jgi:hypothetical protein
MLEPENNREQAGFAFSDDDFRRRYTPEEQSPDGSRASVASASGARPRLHGGGNSYMRARRRRLAGAAVSD